MKLACSMLAILLMIAVIQLSGWQRFNVAPTKGLQAYDESDQNIPSEFFFSRLRYNTGYGGGYGYRRFFGGWTQDFPRADHDCLVVIRRLTRIDSPSPLNVVDIDDDNIMNYPWIYAVGVSNWAFTDAEALRLRNFIQHGGFLMVDHFHGQDDWNRFLNGMNMVLPNAIIEDIPDDDPIFHDLYDIREKFQIPGE